MDLSLRKRLRNLLFLFPAALARLGLVDRKKGEEAFDLAIPVMVTGALRTLLRFVDYLMVSVAIGAEAVAALELGFQYYFIAFGLSLAVSSGTISVVSRFKGADEHDRADFAIKQSLWLALLIAAPLIGIAWVFSEPLIALLTDDPAAIEMGAIYLQIVMLAFAFRFWGLIAARALQGAGDTRTPMYVRLITLPANIVLNYLLIFGVGPFPEMGIAGAAIGTAIANTIAAGIFFVILGSGRWDVRLKLRGMQWDTGIAREIVRVGLPLAGTRMARTFGRFPFLFVLGTLGTPVLAAYAIGRQVMLLALMPAWGYATASSTLVGQSIGAGEDGEANEYGWQTLRIALITQLLLAAVLMLYARPIAHLFGTEYPDMTVTFVRVFGLGVAGFSIARTMQGGLRGAGDTTWPFYGAMVGIYLFQIPVAFLALPAGVAVATVAGVTIAPGLGWGLMGIYAAILGEMYIRAGVNSYRFWTGKWKQVARESEAGAGEETPSD